MSGINRDWPLIRSLTTEPEHEKSNLHQAQASNLRLCCVTKCKEIYERQKMPKVANKSSDVLNCFIEINILFETRNDISHVAYFSCRSCRSFFKPAKTYLKNKTHGYGLAPIPPYFRISKWLTLDTDENLQVTWCGITGRNVTYTQWTCNKWQWQEHECR